MKHLFIVNPTAGGVRENCDDITARISDFMERAGYDHEVYLTTAPMDAAEKVKREAIKGHELRVYACGGDGTLSECVHGAAGYRNAAVTHFPCGTGNDFIKTFSGDTELFTELDRLVTGDVVPMDIVDVNGRRSINISSVGIDARIGVDVHKYSRLPLIKGMGAYCVSLVVNVLKGIARNFTITDGDGRVFSGSTSLACVCNGRYYGGGFNPVKTAMPNDGALDILIVKGVSLFTLARLLGKYSRGEYYDLPKYITYISGRKLTVEADREFVVQIDGEAMYTKRAVIKLIPAGVNFIMPRGSRFFQSEGEKIAVN